MATPWFHFYLDYDPLPALQKKNGMPSSRLEWRKKTFKFSPKENLAKNPGKALQDGGKIKRLSKPSDLPGLKPSSPAQPGGFAQ